MDDQPGQPAEPSRRRAARPNDMTALTARDVRRRAEVVVPERLGRTACPRSLPGSAWPRRSRSAWRPRPPRAARRGSSRPRPRRCPGDPRGSAAASPRSGRPGPARAPALRGERSGHRRCGDSPAVQRTVLASYRVSAPSAVLDDQPTCIDVGHHRVHVDLDTQVVARPRSPCSRASARRVPAASSPPSKSSTRASPGSKPRYSRWSVWVASSRICPASSTPVGPAPTRAKVSHWRRSSGSLVACGHLERSEDPLADLQRVSERLHAGGMLSELVVPEVRLPHPDGEDEVVVRQLRPAPVRPLSQNRRVGRRRPHGLGQDALDVRCRRSTLRRGTAICPSDITPVATW